MKRAIKKPTTAAANADERIPVLCVEALKEAYRRAVADNAYVLISGDVPGGGRAIFEVSADGTRAV